MPVNKLTIQDFAAKVKAKYPEYKDVNDTLLTQKIIAKYPEYKDMVQLEAPQQQPQQPQSPPDKTFADQTLKLSDAKIQQQPQHTNVDVNALNAKHGQEITQNNGMGEYGANVQQATKEKKHNDTETAIKNTADIWAKQNASVLKGFTLSKGVGQKDISSNAVYQQKVNELRSAVDKGDLIVSGNTLARPKGGFASFIQGVSDAWNANKEADKVLTMSDEDLVKYANEKNKQSQEYLPEKADQSGLAYGLGGAVPITAKALGGAAVGTAAAAATPETFGLSLEGAAPFLAWAMSVPDMAKQAKANSLLQYYNRAKQDNPNISDKDAIDQARKVSDAAYGEALATGTALNFIGGNSIPQGTGQGLLKATGQFLLKQPESIAEVGAVSGLGSVAKDLIAKASGVSQKPNEMWDNMSESMKQMAVTQLAFNIGFGTLNAPKYIKAQANEVLSKVNPEALQTLTNESIKNGTITEEQADNANKDISDYQKAKQRIIPTGDEEKDAVITGLVQKKTNLEKSKENVDKSFHPEIDNEIEQVNKKIELAKNSSNPTSVETDDLTGEHNANAKKYDELTSNEKKGIVVPKEYGDVYIKESGEGEDKRYTAIPHTFVEMGGLKLMNPVERIERGFKDKKDAQEVGEKALAKHYYENTLHDIEKPQKGITNENQKAEITNQESNAGSNEGNESISSEVSGIAEGTVNKVGEGTPEEINNNLQENILPLQSNESASQNISKEENQSTENSTRLPIEKSAKEPNYSERLKKIEEVIDPHDRVLEYFANNGKIHSSAIQELFGNKRGKSVQGEQMARVGLQHKNAPSIDKLAHQLWESDTTGKHTTQDYKEAIETVLNNYNSKAAMTKDLVDRYDIETAYEKYLQQAHGQEAIDMVESISEDEINHVLQMESEGASHEELEKYIDNLQSQNPETRKQIADIEEKRNSELHEASKPVIEMERIRYKDFANIEDADKIKSSKEKHTDIFRRKKILEELIDCL